MQLLKPLFICFSLLWIITPSFATTCYQIGDSAFCGGSSDYGSDDRDLIYSTKMQDHSVSADYTNKNPQPKSMISQDELKEIEAAGYQIIGHTIYQYGSSYCQVVNGNMYCD